MKYAHDASNSDAPQSGDAPSRASEPGSFSKYLIDVVELLGRVEDAAERQVGQLLELLEVLGDLVRVVVLLDLAQDRLERVGGELAVVLAHVRDALEELRLGVELDFSGTLWNRSIASLKFPLA